jgi:hypothetical protein
VVESVCRAIHALVDSPEHRQSFIDCGAVDLLRSVSRRSYLGIDVVEEVIDALKRIEEGDVVKRKSLVLSEPLDILESVKTGADMDDADIDDGDDGNADDTDDDDSISGQK